MCVICFSTFILNYISFLFIIDSTVIASSKYGDGDGPILLSNLQCRKESSIFQCPRSSTYIGYHTCSSLSNNAAAVQCDGKLLCTHHVYMFYLLTLILYIITLYLAKANMFYVGKHFFKYNTEI